MQRQTALAVVKMACLRETPSPEGQLVTGVHALKCPLVPGQTIPRENILELRARAA